MASERTRPMVLLCFCVSVVGAVGLRTRSTETLVCTPFPVEPLDDLDYDKFSGDWTELLKTGGGPVSLLGGTWRINFYDNTFGYYSEFSKNQSCASPITGQVHKVLPVGQLELQYAFFGQPVRETLSVVATDYDGFAIVHRCEENVNKLADRSLCPPQATFVTVLTRRVLDEETYLILKQELRKFCIRTEDLEIKRAHENCSMPAASATELSTKDSETSDCLLPVDPGFCRSTTPAFYYNTVSGRCESFNYSGCGGSPNNFLTLQECADKCEGPLNHTFVRSSIPHVVSCTHNSSCGLACPSCCRRRDEDGCIDCNCQASELDPLLRPATCISSPSLCPPQCQSKMKKEGCYECQCHIANGSLVPALEHVAPEATDSTCSSICTSRKPTAGKEECRCTEHTTCNLPLDRGSCNETIPRYFFNTSSSSCEVFTYKGCMGNDNNFATHEDCLAECQDLCHLPKNEGACVDDPQERFYFNPQTGDCETFTYGGCGGNDNNFEDLTSCRMRCKDVCGLPSDSGPCYAYFRRFFYNKESERCEPFVYGGCMGNGNNFYNLKQCNRHCRSSDNDVEEPIGDRSLCHLPLEEGRCNDTETKPETRYFYDVYDEQCEEFIYAGCGGNDNNFRTYSGCNLTCFGVNTISKTAASCPEITCSCGKFRRENGCVVCECGNGASRTGYLTILEIAVVVAVHMFN